MTDDTESHPLELLRALRADLLTVKKKVTDIENHIVQLRIQGAYLAGVIHEATQERRDD